MNRMMSTSWFLLLTALLACLPCFTLRAQSTQATITGSVLDAQGAVVSDVLVIATSAATQVSVQTKTSSSGLYTIPNLDAGVYTVKATHEGFKESTLTNIRLETGQVFGLNIKVDVGAVDQTVNVTDNPPPIDTQTSQIGQVIESTSVAELPLGDRNSTNLLALSGGVVFINTLNYSIAGGRTQTSMVWLDGGNGQQIRIGTGNSGLNPPVDTVREIAVLKNTYSAQFGGSSGGIVLENTISGTNKYHGTLYDFERNNAFDAPGYFATVTNGRKASPPLHYHIFGGTMGGPIWRDHAFFFFGYEGQRETVGTTTTLTVPSLLQRQGDFSQTYTAAGKLIPIYDPATTVGSGTTYTRKAFAGNRILSPRLDPVGLAILNYYPLPNQAPVNIAGASNFSATNITATPSDFYIGKIDYVLGPNDRLVGRYIHYQNGSSNDSVYPSAAGDPTKQLDVHRNDYWMQYVHTFNSSTVNDLRFLLDQQKNLVVTHSQGGNYPSKLGLQGVPDTAFPNITASGFVALGQTAAYRKQDPARIYQLVDDLSLIRGKHSLKLGVELRRSSDSEVNLGTPSGSFTFNTLATSLNQNANTGNGIASLLLGFPQAFNENTTQVLSRHSWYYAAFAQDDFQATPYLTLNLGVRWETDTPEIDLRNRLNSFDPLAINPVSGTPGVVKFAGVNGYPRTPYSYDLNNYGPRFGFAWQPFKKPTTSVRSGVGVFFAFPEYGTPTSAALGFGNSASLSSPDQGITAPFYLRNGVPPLNSVSAPLNDTYGAVPAGATPTTAVTYYDRAHRTGYAYQYNVSVQQVLPCQFVLEVSGLSTLSRKLPAPDQPIDQILPSLVAAGHITQAYRPFPQFNGVTVLGSSTVAASYFAGMVHLQRRFTHGLSFDTSYSITKNLNNGDGVIGQALGQASAPYSNLYNRAADYGPSSNDAHHQIVMSTVFNVPFGAGHRWLNRGAASLILGGWTVGNITRAYSGAPFTVTAQVNNSNAFASGAQRPNVLRSAALSRGARSALAWFDTTAFAQPANSTFGNEQRNSLRGPDFVTTDFSLIRNFKFVEDSELQVRGEALNALNHTNLGLPGAAFGSASFGVISTSQPARIIQIAAHIRF